MTKSANRCPCFGQVPTSIRPEGTACKQPPVTPNGLCAYHGEMFDAIDRRSVLGLRQDMAEQGIPIGGYGDSEGDGDGEG